MLKKIVYSGANNPSYHQARNDLIELGELEMSEKDIRKFTDRVGQELKVIQEETVQQFNETGEVCRSEQHTPTTVAVMVDAGRARIRQENAGRGTHAPDWCAPRYATLRSLSSQTHSSDPHPDVPKAFLDEKHVKALSDEIVNLTKRTPQTGNQESTPSQEPVHHPAANRRHSPTLLRQTCLAAVASSEDFGPMVAAEAWARGFHEAPRKAFVGDGERANWSIQQDFFFEFTPILDFIHCLGHLFSAASAAKGNSPDAWNLYQALVTAAWQGKTNKLIASLEEQSDAVGPPPKNAKPTDRRKVVADALGYVRNNAARMDYPTYRKMGLPISSCHIESLIKQFNFRVKASDKFWIPPCLDNVLQVRAAWLSDDSRWQRFWKERATRIASQTRRYCSAAA